MGQKDQKRYNLAMQVIFKRLSDLALHNRCDITQQPLIIKKPWKYSDRRLITNKRGYENVISVFDLFFNFPRYCIQCTCSFIMNYLQEELANHILEVMKESCEKLLSSNQIY